MRKSSLVAIMLFFGLAAFSQAVSDRNVIPVAVNLNQVLRMNITDGGNIDFQFNTIDDYKDGISGDAGTSGSANAATSDGMYQTSFTVASSTRWKITYGAENATFVGTDDPANTIALNNVGYELENNGVHIFEGAANAIGTTAAASLFSVPTVNTSIVAPLVAYPIDLITDNNSATNANAGDVADNDFTMVWRCGTSEGAMNATSLINVSPDPDRYVVNVLFDLSVD